MLNPNSRSLYTSALTPPPGMIFDEAVATTFSMDPALLLEAPVYLALMSAELTNTHVRSPVLIERVPALVGNVLQLIALVVGTVFIAWMTYLTFGGAIHAIVTGEFRHGVIFVSTWPAKTIIPIGLAGLTIALLIKVVRTARRIITKEPPEIIEYDNPL